jgi:hypothetical protein
VRDVDKNVRPPLRLPQWANFQGPMSRQNEDQLLIFANKKANTLLKIISKDACNFCSKLSRLLNI